MPERLPRKGGDAWCARPGAVSIPNIRTPDRPRATRCLFRPLSLEDVLTTTISPSEQVARNATALAPLLRFVLPVDLGHTVSADDVEDADVKQAMAATAHDWLVTASVATGSPRPHQP